ncbi:MAG: carboxypeptidase regulatory-like domain-containing protein [Ignavibacteriales bacterium]|nr:carboxypeptidase regulatory-like domain-containing protein [Ignavibacteriales bacterium]
MKRFLTAFILTLLGAMTLFAQTEDPSFKLFAMKVDLTGEVKLLWTRPAGAPANTSYELYRAKVSDSTTFTLVTTTNDTVYIDKIPTPITAVSNSYAYYVYAKFNTTILKTNVIVIPVPGVPPIGAFKLEGKLENGKVKLLWHDLPVNTPASHFLVYRGKLGDAIVLHERIDSTTANWSITDAPVVPEGSHVTFVFYVKAVLPLGEVLISTTLQLTIYNRPDYDDVAFVSVPPKYGQVGKKYEYTAKAVSSDSTAVLRYSGWASQGLLAVIVPEFKIDSVTGVVNWTPAAKGWYHVVIQAKSSKGGHAKQEYAVAIAGGNGIVQGKVSDTLNAGISKVLIELFKVEHSTVFSFAYSTLTDENGNYRIARIDPGSYKLRASAPGRYQSQWYDGVREVGQATVITVADSPAVTIANFKLRGGGNVQPKVTVSGSVKDTIGFAIVGRNSRVVFVRAEFALNLGGGLNLFSENMRKFFELNMHGDFRLEGNSEHVFKTQTDSLGNYTIQLPHGAYIAFARAKGYETEFYNEQSNILSADIIRIPDPRLPPMNPPINFTLAPLPPVVLGEITGAVMDSVKDIYVPARLIAFRDGWRINDHHRVSRVYVTDTDSTGHYTFEDLLPGTYVVMAVPLGNYAPAFYSKDTSNMRWKRATKIVVNGNSVDDINIYVHPFGPSANGYTGITGTVNISGGSMMQGSVKAGGVVYAYREGEIASYAFTNAEGNYAITGLSAGSYSVFVDKPGYNESVVMNAEAGYTVSGTPVSGTANFTIEGTTGVTVDRTVQPTQYVLDQNYPNPFNPSTTISYLLPNAEQVTLKVYDLLGKEVVTLVNGYQQSGKYTVTFNAARLSSGIYFYRLESGKNAFVKKMILMK